MILALVRDLVIGVCFGVAAMVVLYAVRHHDWGGDAWGADDWDDS